MTLREHRLFVGSSGDCNRRRRQHEAGHFDLIQRRRFRLGVDAKDIKKYLGICLDDLALAQGYALAAPS